MENSSKSSFYAEAQNLSETIWGQFSFLIPQMWLSWKALQSQACQLREIFHCHNDTGVWTALCFHSPLCYNKMPSLSWTSKEFSKVRLVATGPCSVWTQLKLLIYIFKANINNLNTVNHNSGPDSSSKISLICPSLRMSHSKLTLKAKTFRLATFTTSFALTCHCKQNISECHSEVHSKLANAYYKLFS